MFKILKRENMIEGSYLLTIFVVAVTIWFFGLPFWIWVIDNDAPTWLLWVGSIFDWMAVVSIVIGALMIIFMPDFDREVLKDKCDRYNIKYTKKTTTKELEAFINLREAPYKAAKAKISKEKNLLKKQLENKEITPEKYDLYIELIENQTLIPLDECDNIEKLNKELKDLQDVFDNEKISAKAYTILKDNINKQIKTINK